jgi:hypothetical protein
MGIMVRALAICLCLGALLAGCNERISASYPDRAAAEQDGAFLRGWLPAWMPASVRDIEEVHDLDTNAHALHRHIGLEAAHIAPVFSGKSDRAASSAAVIISGAD